MIAKHLTVLMTLSLFLNGCSLLGSKKVEVISKPIRIEIQQPAMPRAIDLGEPFMYVVSEAKFQNLCNKDVDGNRLRTKLDDKWTCDLGKEYPDLPEDYTVLDKFIADMKKQNSGDVVFVAMSIADYELMAKNFQEIRRYVREVQGVILYYREVTLPDGTPGVGVQVTKQ